MDTLLLEQTVKRLKRTPLFASNIDEDKVYFSKDIIQAIIPHRHPFLLIDSITGLQHEKCLIKGERSIQAEDPIFPGHFPDKPIYPGVLQIEMMAQLGLCLSYFILNNTRIINMPTKPVEAMITKLHYAAFNSPILPNDKLTIYASILHHDTMTGLIAGQIYSDHQLCSYSILEAYFND